MNDADVVVIGAGLTGLRAALEVVRAGLSVLVVERENEVGGRIRTSLERGCLLDHGFQVILSAYPELLGLPSLEPLQLAPFLAGARVRMNGEQYDILDPVRHPSSVFKTLRTPIASLMDLTRLGCFTFGLPWSFARAQHRSCAEALDQWRFSPLFRSAFLNPFLRGVLLDPNLSSDAGLATFYLRTFARGRATLPAAGMQALPNHLAASLGRQHILLSSTVTHLRSDRVILATGEEIRARHVICAVDALSAAALGGPEQTTPLLGTATIYFLADRAPYSEPILTISGDSRGPINNLAVLTNVQKSYSPVGTALISVSIVGDQARRPNELLLPEVRKQLHDWFGPSAANWEHIRTFRIDNALPARPRLTQGSLTRDGIVFAGDYLSYGSHNGALQAGRAAALSIVAE